MSPLRAYGSALGVFMAVVLLLTAGAAAAISADETVVTLRPALDGTVVDTDSDGRGDWVYDGLGSVVVGYGHPALGVGEDRGVFEFPLPTVNTPICIASASLTFSVPGYNGDWSTDYSLMAGVADGSLATSDYGRTSNDKALTSRDEQALILANSMSVDVTREVQLATLMTRTPNVTGVRFVLRQTHVAIGLVGSILVGSNELEDAYGSEYTQAARLTITYTC